MIHEKIVGLLSDFDVISFDIFDTLLLRPYLKPTDLWKDLERWEGVKGFFVARYRADRASYAAIRHSEGEATLDDVYARLSDFAGMKEKELALERKVLLANPEIVELWRRAGELGKKRVIVSDMYLPIDFVRTVLRENGIDGWNGLYLSSDKQKKKRSGELFSLMMEEQRVAPDKVLHIGDDKHADVETPNRLGIVAFWYQRIADKFLEELPFVVKFLRINPSFEKELLVGVLARGWHLYKCAHPEWTYWNRIGYLFAGTLGYVYMRFCGENAKRRGINHFMMVARDGYVLQKICNILYPEIRTDYFYASRITALFATQYFGSFGVGVTNRRRYCADFLKKNSGVGFTAEQESEFIENGKLPAAAQAELDRISRQERENSESYLSRFAIDPDKTALIDGTSGHFTVQRFLGAILKKDIYAYYLQTLSPAVNGAALYQCGWVDARYLGFSEFLFGAPTPPVDRVAEGKPVFKSDMLFYERFKVGVCEKIELGAIECVKALNQLCLGVSKLTWLDLNDAFMDNQTLEDHEYMSFARDSVAPGHEKGYFPVVRSLCPKRFYVCGRCLVQGKIRRFGEHYVEDLYLFGWLKIPLANFLRRVYRCARQLVNIRGGK